MLVAFIIIPLFLGLHLVIYSRESAENCYVPNTGFFEDVVFEDPALFSSSLASNSCEDDSAPGQTEAIINECMGDALQSDGTAPTLDSAPKCDPTEADGVGAQITSAMVDLQVVENASVSESNVDEQHPLSVEDVDSLLDKCLLQALHTTVKDTDLPMLGSILW